MEDPEWVVLGRSEYQIEEQFSNDYLNIYYISSGKYNKFNLCGYEAISYYAIVPMIID